MNNLGKRIVTLGIALAGLTVCGKSFMHGWSPTRGADKKCITVENDKVTLSGAEKGNWIYFNPKPAAVSKDDKVEIRFTVSGTGKLKIGFLAYESGWKGARPVVKDYELAAEPKKEVINFSVPAGSGIVRSVIVILPGSKAVFQDFKMQVIKNGDPQQKVPAAAAKQ